MIRPGDAKQLFMPDLPYRDLGSPLIRLTGDEFCTATESALYLLENINQTVGGGVLTNNGTTPFTFDADFGNIVAVLNGSTQSLSRATETATQVGTNSFMASIAFKTTTTGVQQTLFCYGDVTTRPVWMVDILSTNVVRVLIGDGTNTINMSDPVPNRWQDGRWHIATVYLDRTYGCWLIIDGVFVVNQTTTIPVLTLTNAGKNLTLGVSTNGTLQNYFNGSLALFKLINNTVDYNVPQVWNMGTREAVGNGGISIDSVGGQRLNSRFYQTSPSSGTYSYATVFTEDGEYEIQEIYNTAANSGISQLIIDGNLISTTDQYAASGTVSNVKKTYGVKLSAGRHTVKIFTNSKNASSTNYFLVYNWINFIKRRGHENGGLTKALLLGDEINERSNASQTAFGTDTAQYYNSEIQNSWTANSSYTEGSLFLKGGLYRIDLIGVKGSNGGKIDIWFGNVLAFSQVDFYNGSTVQNSVTTNLVRLQQGRQDIRILANGKNGSSANYYAFISSIKLERVSD